jgi:hypothetical protein
MHDLVLANVIFHTLSTLALFGVSAATALHNPLRRRGARQYVALVLTPEAPAPDRIDLNAMPREHALDLDLELAEAA